MGRKPGRPRTGQEVLSREVILEKALQIVDTEGITALNMRRLATDLAVDPMALYRHVANKETLLAGLVERVFSELKLEADEGTSWQDQVRLFGTAYHDLALRHSNLVIYLVTNAKPHMAAILTAIEFLYAALATTELSDQQIIRSADLVADYVHGFALAESAAPLGGLDDRGNFWQLLDEQPADRFPTLKRIYTHTAPAQATADFETGLNIIIAGIETLSGG